MREYVPGPDVDKQDGVEKVSFTVAGKTEVYEYVVKSPDTTRKWHNCKSDLTGDQQPVPPGTLLWYYHATEKELTITMGGTVLCIQQGKVVFSYEQKIGSLFENTKQSLDDVSLSQDGLNKNAGMLPAKEPYLETAENSVMLVFGEKRVLAQLRLGDKNKINFVDASTGKTLTEKIAAITDIGTKTPEQAKGLVAIILGGIKQTVRDELAGTCTDKEWEKNPRKHYFAAVVVWGTKNIAEFFFGVLVGCVFTGVLFVRKRLSSWFLPGADKQPTPDNKRVRKPKRMRRKKSREGS